MSKIVAITVEYDTPDLLALCHASLERFAPSVRRLVVPGGEGAAYHARGIEDVRARGLGDAEVVILLDSDTVVCSPEWLDALTVPLAAGSWAVGGVRNRGDVEQVYHRGRPMLHASCLAMTRAWFEHVLTFAADPDLDLVRRDTAWRVSADAPIGKVSVYPFWRASVFPLGVGEYYGAGGTLLWAHLWRGTVWRGSTGAWPRLKARVSRRAAKVLRHRQMAEAFLAVGWRIVHGG